MAFYKLSLSRRPIRRSGKAVIAATLLFTLAAPASYAQSNKSKKPSPHVYKNKIAWAAPARTRLVTRPVNVVVKPSLAAPRRRTVNNRVVYRRYGPPIYGYGFYTSDAAASRWLAFTGFGLVLANQLQEQQLRYYEQAQIEAASAPVGETIVWNDGGASGTTTALRQGFDGNGYVCREFKQTITINGNFEEANGTACLQSDGTWNIVS